MNYINGVPLTRQNIAFIKGVQQKDRENKRNELAARVSKVKNFSKDAPAIAVVSASVKTKKSHAERRAAIVARSIAHDPKNKQKR